MQSRVRHFRANAKRPRAPTRGFLLRLCSKARGCITSAIKNHAILPSPRAICRRQPWKFRSNSVWKEHIPHCSKPLLYQPLQQFPPRSQKNVVQIFDSSFFAGFDRRHAALRGKGFSDASSKKFQNWIARRKRLLICRRKATKMPPFHLSEGRRFLREKDRRRIWSPPSVNCIKERQHF